MTELVVSKAPKSGWYNSQSRAEYRQWWDGKRWHDAYWPQVEGIQPRRYAPELRRIDISSQAGPVVDIVGEAYREPQIVAALGYRPGLNVEAEEFVMAELVPEKDNPHDANAVAVRIHGHTVGYIDAMDAKSVHPFVAGIVQRGAVPIVQARIWAVTRSTRRGPEVKSAIRIALPELSEIFPANQPPAAAYTIVPRGRKVQVTGEEQHLEYLSDYLSPVGDTQLLFTLERADIPTRTGMKSVALVLLDGEPIGELSSVTSKNALPLVDAQSERGLRTAAWGRLAGSRIAAEVTLSLPRATDIADAWLDGPAVTVPELPSETMTALPAAYAEPVVVPAAPAANSTKWVWVLAAVLALLLLAIPYVGWVLSIGALVGAFFAARAVRARPPQLAIGRW
jgi:hypothetical protein